MSSPLGDPGRCPLCERPNDCGAARGASTCWCVTAVIPAEVLAHLPGDERGARCVCAACVERLSAPSASGTMPG